MFQFIDQTVGFPKLKNCGGFELMNCAANCRNLNVLNCEWSVKSLKSCIGGQSRIYIRPIQISLRTTPLVAEKPSEIEATCHVCGKQVLVRNMRTHSALCVENFLTNYILVDRANILTTSLDEIKDITDLRRTLQVEFYGEVSNCSFSVTCLLMVYSTIGHGYHPLF